MKSFGCNLSINMYNFVFEFFVKGGFYYSVVIVFGKLG